MDRVLTLTRIFVEMGCKVTLLNDSEFVVKIDNGASVRVKKTGNHCGRGDWYKTYATVTGGAEMYAGMCKGYDDVKNVVTLIIADLK